MIDRIPILRIRDLLLVSIQADLHDILVEQLQGDILKELERKSAHGLVLDISALQVLDTYTARAFVHTAQMARLMGTRTIVSGMTPAIALTLTEMGFSASGFETALDLESALAALSAPESADD
jgi:rsbT antagonist protein RsbS